jgi:Flp pilus assembly pilin Flp
MRTSLRQLPFRSRGAAAVELAILLATILPVLLAGVLLFGRYFWYYTVAQKAALNAATFLAAASPADFKTLGPRGLPPVVNAALLIAEKEVEGLQPGYIPVYVDAYCDRHSCSAGNAVPQNITVRVYATVEDPFLSRLSEAFLGTSTIEIPLNAIASVGYVGN